jgi:hypothetical protein
MTDYALKHAAALRKMARKGQAVTFTLNSPGTPVPSTGRYTSPQTTSVGGYAVQVKDEAQSADGDNVRRNYVTLAFIPSTYGDVPPKGSDVTWGGREYRARPDKVVAPVGEPLVTFVVLE